MILLCLSVDGLFCSLLPLTSVARVIRLAEFLYELRGLRAGFTHGSSENQMAGIRFEMIFIITHFIEHSLGGLLRESQNLPVRRVSLRGSFNEGSWPEASLSMDRDDYW